MMEKGFLIIIIISELELLAMCELCDWLKSAKEETRGPQQATRSGKG